MSLEGRPNVLPGLVTKRNPGKEVEWSFGPGATGRDVCVRRGLLVSSRRKEWLYGRGYWGG